MSQSYPDLINTKFPDELDNFPRMQDISIEDVSLINQYDLYMQNGNINAANQILIDNPQLKIKIMNAYNINNIGDAAKAVQRFFNDNVQGFISVKQSEMENYVDNLKSEIDGTWSNFVDRGAYIPGTPYYKFNFVNFNDGTGNYTYMAWKDSLNKEPTDTLYWKKLTIQGQRGEAGVGLVFRGAWDNEETYVINDAVQFGNIIFGALQPSTGQQPNITADTVYWAKALSMQITTTKLSAVRSITSSTNNINFITGQITVFNPSTDSIEVFMNSVRLTQGYDYTLNVNNQSIDKTNGDWAGSVEQPIFFEFVVLRNQCNDLIFTDGNSIQNNTISISKLNVDAKPYISVTPPSSPKVGQVWIDIS